MSKKFSPKLLDRLIDSESPSARVNVLLSILVNISMIPEADFNASYSSRTAAIATLHDEIMLWQTLE
ncbi:MAG: hypothetical protein AAFW73_26630 [Bacteroidota bacterium]